MQQLLLSIINGFVFSFFIYFGGCLIYNKKNICIYRFLIAIILYVISFVINTYYFTPLFAIFFYYISIVIFLKIVFKSELTNTLFVALIIYDFRMLVELFLIAFPCKCPEVIYAFHLMTLEKFCCNVISAIITLLLMCILKRLIIRLVKRIDDYPNKSFIVVSLIHTSLMIVFFIKMPYLEKNLNLIYEVIIILVITIVTMIIINQEHKMHIMLCKYHEVTNYAKLNDKLIEEYRKDLNARQKQLLTIHDMLKKSSNETEKYVEGLLKEKESIISEWLRELEHIPMMELRGVIRFKLMEIENAKIHAEILVSDSVSKIENMESENIKDLCSIVGILLDNAVEAAIESKDKIVSIQIYCEENNIHVVIANNFNENIHMNSDEINLNGCSAKESRYRTGLAIITNIIKNHDIYHLDTRIFQNFFVQDLMISILSKK